MAYQEAVASLFREKKDPLEVIKWKDVYESMEGCIDHCEAVAHVLESVVLKMLSKKPADRHQSSAELLAELTRVAKYQNVNLL